MPDLSRAFVPIRSALDDIWMFDTRSPHFQTERRLNVLLFVLVVWNFVSYSQTVSMLVMLCCNMELLWILFRLIRGYKRGASDDQISKLRRWRYKEEAGDDKDRNALPTNQVECCICLAKYNENEEMRQLPCSHIFHQVCVDQWLKIRSSCPLCKQQLEGKKTK